MNSPSVQVAPARRQSRCQDCGRQWTGLAEAHCAACCRHFTSDSAFDRHLAPVQSDDDCFPPETFVKRDGSPVFKLIQRAGGATWTLAGCPDTSPRPLPG